MCARACGCVHECGCVRMHVRECHVCVNKCVRMCVFLPLQAQGYRASRQSAQTRTSFLCDHSQFAPVQKNKYIKSKT